MFIDSHVHFDRFVKDGTFDEILANAKEAQVHEMVAIGGSTEANALSCKLAEEHPGQIFGCAGYDRDEAERLGVPEDHRLVLDGEAKVMVPSRNKP